VNKSPLSFHATFVEGLDGMRLCSI